MSSEASRNFNTLGPEHISNQSPAQIAARIEGTSGQPNELYSESLTMARWEIAQTGNADLLDSFKTVAAQLMTGENARHGGSGFGLRDATGLAVTRMLASGDTATFDRIHENAKFDQGYDALLKSSLKALQSELKAHCIENGIKVHSTHAPAPKNAPALKA